MSALSTSHRADETLLMMRPGKWTLTIVTLLREETRRFSELRRSAEGISQKTLTITLRELERDGFVTRRIFATIPPRVEYTLTTMGRDLLALADSLLDFAEQHADGVRAARQKFDQSGDGPVIRLVHPD